MILLLSLTFSLLLFLFFLKSGRPSNFPPGFPIFPIVGSLPYIPFTGSRFIRYLSDFVDRYGDVMGFYILNTPMVIVQDLNIAKKLCMDDNFTGRLSCFYRSHVRGFGSKIGLLTTDGDLWKSQRRFTLSKLKNLGFGKTTTEDIIMSETELMIDHLTSSSQPVAMGHFFNIPIFNILWQLVAGERFGYKDPKLLQLIHHLQDLFKSGFTVAFMEKSIFSPLINLIYRSRLITLLPGYKTKIQITTELKKIMRDTIEKHQENLNSEEPKDFIDVYLKEISKVSEEEDESDANFNVDQLIGLCMDFFEAGGETVGSTLNWSLLYLAHHPQVQIKCQEEISRELGDDPVSWKDKQRLPYCEATVLEIQRLSATAPASLEHRALVDAQLDKFWIPKDTLVYCNIWRFLRSSQYWDQPDIFRPERFLSQGADGDFKVVVPEQFVPFGFGRRVCLGESLAKQEIFLMTVRMIQRMEVKFPEGEEEALGMDEDVMGITRNTKPYNIVCQPIK